MWVGDDVLDEVEGVKAVCLDDVEVTVLLGLKVLQLEMGLQTMGPDLPTKTLEVGGLSD